MAMASALSFCAYFSPLPSMDLLCPCSDFDSLEERDLEKNNQLAFDVAEQEFGISPIMTGKEMSSVGEPDKLSMVMYLSQFYEMFKDTVPPGGECWNVISNTHAMCPLALGKLFFFFSFGFSENNNLSPEDKAALIASTKSPISFLSKLGQSITRKRNPKVQITRLFWHGARW